MTSLLRWKPLATKFASLLVFRSGAVDWSCIHGPATVRDKSSATSYLQFPRGHISWHPKSRGMPDIPDKT